MRAFEERDWPSVWELMQPIIRAGDTYPYARDMSREEAYHAWIEHPDATCVATDDEGHIVGTYYVRPNQPPLGGHVANCGYMVADHARGQGVGACMCEHSQSEAARLGYRAMQFNLVVATNAASFHLWKKMGFDVVGSLPGAFLHPSEGFVDAYVMYKVLQES